MSHRTVAHIARYALAAVSLACSAAQAQTPFPEPAPATPYAIPSHSGQVNTAPPLIPPVVSDLKLYALDCGTVQLPDMGMFSDTGEYDGRPGTLAAPCFVISHPKGTLLWDTGLGDTLAGQGPVAVDGGVVLHVERSLQSQLQLIGLQAVDFVAFSHFHFDHTGNAGAHTDAHWLVNRHEMEAALASTDAFINVDAVRPSRGTHIINVEGDHDVFGDGSVRILRAPGHTAGHQVLLLRLPNSGPVILSGDLYHTRENRQYQRVPAFNTNRADSLASMNRIETLARNLGARIIIQHDPRDFADLPTAPAYLN